MSLKLSSDLNKSVAATGTFQELWKDKRLGQVSMLTIEPYQKRGGHYHKELECEIFTLIKGHSCFTEKKTLKKGDSVIYRKGQYHSFQNPNPTSITLLIYRPTVFDSEETDTYA